MDRKWEILFSMRQSVFSEKQVTGGRVPVPFVPDEEACTKVYPAIGWVIGDSGFHGYCGH